MTGASVPPPRPTNQVTFDAPGAQPSPVLRIGAGTVGGGGAATVASGVAACRLSVVALTTDSISMIVIIRTRVERCLSFIIQSPKFWINIAVESDLYA